MRLNHIRTQVSKGTQDQASSITQEQSSNATWNKDVPPCKGKSRCPYSRDCGACQMIDIPYQEQLQIKQRRLSALLKPFCSVQPIIGMENPLHYRAKVHAVMTHGRGGVPLAGTYKEGTHEVVPIENCLIEEERAGKIIRTILQLMKDFKYRAYDEDNDYGLFRHVLIRVGKESGEILVVLVLTSPILPSKNHFVRALRAAHPEITSLVLNINDKRTSMVLGEREKILFGKGAITDDLMGMHFKISPASFYQVNPTQTVQLYETVLSLGAFRGTEKVLDCYCGVGTIGMIVSPHVKQVWGVELNAAAVRDATLNARENRISNIRFVKEDAGVFMQRLAVENRAGAIDVVIMDPPRSGATMTFLRALLALSPSKILYVSCNPDTLARDLKVLTTHGYRALCAVPVDMFPQTVHVETIALLQKEEL